MSLHVLIAIHFFEEMSMSFTIFSIVSFVVVELQESFIYSVDIKPFTGIDDFQVFSPMP